MKPYEIFTIREYDMVVAVTFDAINRGLRKLAEADTKFHTLIIEMTFDDQGDRVGKLHDKWDTVPTNPANGLPVNTTLRGEYIPTVTVSESGWVVQLGVEFTSGSVWFRDVFSGNIRPAQNLAGWKWSIPIKVGFAEIRNENRTRLIPDVVKNHLEHFTSQGFLISSIFCDLQNIDLLSTVPAVATTDPNVTIKDVYKTMFSTLLADWLGHVKQNAAINPYILGYVPSYPTSSDPDADVPDSLKPVGNTFNVFFDPAEQPRSTLNFIINTKSSSIRPGTQPPTDIFDSSWLSPTDICDGKMSFSFRSFVETLVLRTFYDTYAAGIHEQISSGGIDLGAFKTYDEAKTPTDTGYHFDVYDAQGDPLNQCKTNFDVSFSKSSQGISIDIAGYLYWYKEKKKHVTVAGKSEVARAWAGGEMSWKATIPITLQDGDSDTPKFEVAKPILVPTPIRTWHDQNGVSKSLGQIEHLIGDLIKVGGILTLFSSSDWLLLGVFGLNLVKLPSLPTVKA
ncbi:uncharacterized protein TRIVIDRAFT_64734 [Trichoderma virens Gv29-8]|uniref:Uncharacterized protein n=1 Tax=Hypocrea virens (strain Gv29-8 / FGSC 10586) TaxID=413071 RepID=G9NCC7_HYPVG|nr:uncharacterized protein TRIVIDRAFT_64734 [Trichoderma virens Gv29-8]EHK15351.1 hypothetical protein TRIVIDRAFT_64734 [Trichoderma virens Gv29-8]